MIFARKPIKYRCLNCKRPVREGERHNYVRCISGTSLLTRIIDWFDDRAGKVLATIAALNAGMIIYHGYAWAAVVVTSAVAIYLGHQIDRLERRRD